MKHLIAILTLFAAQNLVAQERTCFTAVQNAAAVQAANQLGSLVQDVKLARWEESAVNSRGNVDVSISMYRGKKLSHLLVKTHQADCSIVSIKDQDETDLHPLALQSMKYKLAIKETVWMSEGDSEWFVFYTTEKVPAHFSKASLRKALGVDAATEIEFYSHDEALAVITADESMEAIDRHHYEMLKQEMLKDFTEIRGVKVGKPDSGALELIIFGRTSDGRLVGLKTITVET